MFERVNCKQFEIHITSHLSKESPKYTTTNISHKNITNAHTQLSNTHNHTHTHTHSHKHTHTHTQTHTHTNTHTNTQKTHKQQLSLLYITLQIMVLLLFLSPFPFFLSLCRLKKIVWSREFTQDYKSLQKRSLS